MPVTDKLEESSKFCEGAIEKIVYLLEHLNNLIQTDSSQVLCLSPSKLNLYIDFLVEGGFVNTLKYNNGNVNYGITEKGSKFLKDYDRLKSIL